MRQGGRRPICYANPKVDLLQLGSLRSEAFDHGVDGMSLGRDRVVSLNLLWGRNINDGRDLKRWKWLERNKRVDTIERGDFQFPEIGKEGRGPGWMIVQRKEPSSWYEFGTFT